MNKDMGETVFEKAGERHTARLREWEGRHTPEQIKAADEERLARLRLKFRLKGMVEQSVELRATLCEAQELITKTRRRARKPMAAAAGSAMRARDKISKETRSVQLAHGFLRDVAYARMEQKCWTKPDWPRVEMIVRQYAPDVSQAYWQRYEQWYQAARQHLRDGAFLGDEPSESEIMQKLLRRRDKLESAIAGLGRSP